MYQEQLAKIMKKFADKEGTTFHAFVINLEDEERNTEPVIYMNNDMMSDMTGIEVETLKWHYKDSDKREELSEDDGMLSVTGSQLKKEIILTVRVSHGKNSSECYIPAHFGKDGRFSTIVYSDNSSYTLSNQKTHILSLKSVKNNKIYKYKEIDYEYN